MTSIERKIHDAGLVEAALACRELCGGEMNPLRLNGALLLFCCGAASSETVLGNGARNSSNLHLCKEKR